MPIELIYDGQLDIATGRSRHETNWKNKASSWSALLDRLSTTKRTHESFAEYLASKKPRQDELKDVGGFIGGYLSGGRRAKGSVNYRQLVTLDIDFAPQDVWSEFTLLYGCAAAVYSTHKHSPDKPRLRLIIPLDRHVLCDEYVAIARRLAGTIGIEYFDDTTYQPERLMYWPSTSSDGVYEFQFQDGPFLCADDILATYRDWTDSSEWPVSDRVGVLIHRAMKKQGDPLEKPGIVGAFCRTFTIHDAIAQYLSDVYTPCDIEGRYTYVDGSTSGGLVTYEDKFAYSHHGTDPVSMKLCNAFDLVRIHLYGLRDDRVRPETPVNKYPSHLAMEELAGKDARVRKLVVGERLQAAREDFADMLDNEDEETPDLGTNEGSPDDEDNDEWQAKLACDKKGVILSTVANAVIIMENAPELKGRFAFDEFRHRPVLRKNLPWRKVTANAKFVTDTDENVLYHHLEKVYGVNATKLDKVLSVVYNNHSFHPVRDYLTPLVWDRKLRAESLFIDYLGAADTPYTRAVTRKTLTAAVARIFEPGIKFDNVLTLIGDEGLLKSTIFKKLGGEWFTDNFSFGMIKGKEGSEQIQGYWIVEVPEMGGFRKADRNEVKAFISRSIDSYRPAYGRNQVVLPRQGIIVSTSNERDPLHENEGNRRVWPVPIYVNKPVRSVRTDLTVAEVAQIWAEALAWYRKGETVYLSAEMERVAKAVQREHTEEHPWTGTILKYLDTPLPENWAEMDRWARLAWLDGSDPLQPGGTELRAKVCVAELWCEALKRPEREMNAYNTRDLHGIMRSLPNWTDADARLRYGIYGPQRRGYVRRTDTSVNGSAVVISELHKN